MVASAARHAKVVLEHRRARRASATATVAIHATDRPHQRLEVAIEVHHQHVCVRHCLRRRRGRTIAGTKSLQLREDGAHGCPVLRAVAARTCRGLCHHPLHVLAHPRRELGGRRRAHREELRVHVLKRGPNALLRQRTLEVTRRVHRVQRRQLRRRGDVQHVPPDGMVRRRVAPPRRRAARAAGRAQHELDFRGVRVVVAHDRRRGMR